LIARLSLKPDLHIRNAETKQRFKATTAFLKFLELLKI
jgi:hypothetical protein